MDALQKLAAEIAEIERRVANARVMAASLDATRDTSAPDWLAHALNGLAAARESIERTTARVERAASRRAA